MVENLRIVLYLAAGVCFILGLKYLGRASTARRGNMISAFGMGLAVLATLIFVIDKSGFGAVGWVIAGLIVGAAVGAPIARKVQMTAMPEMVALFNGFGGIASLLVAWSQLHRLSASVVENMPAFVAVSIFLAMLIGGLTFTGSLIAFGKLSGKVTQKPVLYAAQNVVNGGALLVVVILAIIFASNGAYWAFAVALALSLFLGVALTIPIGGADMPVVISLLNSYSGLAACAAGVATSNKLLIITGALVGASGIILTKIMCKAMNRSLGNVLFSGFGAAGGSVASGPGEKRESKAMSPEDAYYILEAAQSVVFVPGYGMAVAQAQHVVRELAETLEKNGCEAKFAIHPVAGRMPGHMNVLLAEANVPYEQLVEPDDVNPSMEMVDVAIVIGANDVVNPSARDDEGCSIYGMPIIECDKAKTVFILKRSMASGFAGVDNPLFFGDNSYMIFGDAKKTLESLLAEFKEAAAA